MTKDEAREMLKTHCLRGATVYNVLEHVSQSGMTRHIKSFVFEYDGTKIHDYFISGWISILLDRKRPANRDGVRVVGCGMDMGFDLVYRLSMELYGDGYALNARWL